MRQVGEARGADVALAKAVAFKMLFQEVVASLSCASNWW
jgi:hypothetical protein